MAELQDVLGMGQSRISSHLAQLKRAGVVEDRRAGKNVYYGLTNGQKLDPQRAKVSELTRALAREMPETQRDRSALKVVLRKRQDKAREYFDQLAGRFGRSYCPGRSWQALAHTMIALLPPLTVADLGAGEGTLAQLLAKKARKVIAVDNAPKMVEFGAQLAKRHGFKNLEYRLGDIEDPPIDKELDRPRVPESGVASRDPSGARHRRRPSHFEKGRSPRDARPAQPSLRKGARTLRRSLARLQRSAIAPMARRSRLFRKSK